MSFPNGLFQPPGSFRFSADALHLANFLQPTSKERFLADLGTGCGIVGIAALLQHLHLTVVGLEREKVLCDAAHRNAHAFGVGSRFFSAHCDLAHISTIKTPLPDVNGEPTPVQAGAFDIVLANPPYYKEEQGRRPQSALRRSALFDDTALHIFCRAAALLLKPKGRFGIIFPAARLPELFSTLSEHTLAPRRLRSIHTRVDKAAATVLVEARKGVKPDLRIEPPLYYLDNSFTV